MLYKLIDTDDDGKISFEEIKEVLSEIHLIVKDDFDS